MYSINNLSDKNMKPCPFCGSYSLSVTSSSCGHGMTEDHVLCFSCGAKGPSTQGDTKQVAIDAWNQMKGVKK